jgi:hypothetical protein
MVMSRDAWLQRELRFARQAQVLGVVALGCSACSIFLDLHGVRKPVPVAVPVSAAVLIAAELAYYTVKIRRLRAALSAHRSTRVRIPR